MSVNNISLIIGETRILQPEIQQIVDEYPEENRISITDYFMQLKVVEIKALLIAKKHLKSSFNILKSNGYIEYINSIAK